MMVQAQYKKLLTLTALLAVSQMISGCFILGKVTNLTGSLALSGSVMNVTVNSVASLGSGATCNPTVTLYQMNSDGSYQSPAIATTSLNLDGSFSFGSLAGTTFDAGLSGLSYALVADPCNGDTPLVRLVTGWSQQNISQGSTLLSYIPQVKQVPTRAFSQVSSVSADQVEALLNDLSTSDIASSYQAGLNSSQAVTQFQNAFGFPLSQLQYSLPTVSSVTTVGTVDELQSAAMSVSATHWDPNITLAYLWKINGTVVGTTKNLNWTPGKNDQGSDTVDLYVGIDTTGTGALDISKSYAHQNFNLLVNNTYPPVPPPLSLVSASVTNSLNATLALNTGASLSNCQSFSKLVFTESSTSAALTLPSSSDFSSANAFTCSTSGTQNQNFTMSMYDGNHTIALWGQDAAGNITQMNSADFVNVLVDQTPPTVSPLSVPSAFLGGGTTPISFSASDATSGIASIKLYFSSDGSTFSFAADLTSVSSPFTWTVPTDNTSTAALRLIATDNAGNSTTVTSNSFSISSTAPPPLVLTFTNRASMGTTSGGLALNNQTTNAVSISGCSGAAVKMLFKEVDTTEGTSATTPTDPLATDPNWISCASSASWVSSSGDSEKTYFAWDMDNVGNISSASTGLPFILDQTSPVLSLTSFNVANLAVAAGSTQLITWNASDAHFGTLPIQLQYTLDGSTWTTIQANANNGSNSGCTVPGGSTGCYSWTTPTLSGGSPIDTATANVRAIATDSLGNPSTPILGTVFSIRSTAPVLSAVTINGGVLYAKTTLVNLNVGLTDHGFSTEGMQVLFNQAATPTSVCNQPASPVWVPWTSTSENLAYHLSTVNGLKKVCVWAMNSAGFASQPTSFTCTGGVDCNNIDLEVGNPPTITTFTVSSSGGYTAPVGATITINWAAGASGTLGLDNNPMSFAYTLDNVNWLDIVTNQNISNPAQMTWTGGLSGNPTTGSGTLSFSSPSNGFSRLRAIARDTAGNLSIVAYSNVFNTTMANGGVWQIYAGSLDRGVGGGGQSASLYDNGGMQSVQIDPTTGNIYARDNSGTSTPAFRVLNVLTGLVTTFIQNGTLNLSTNGGALPAQISAPVGDSARMVLGKDGMIYFHPGGGNYPIYKIDLVNNKSSIYAGGGMEFDSDSNSQNIFVQETTPLAIDDQNNLYFWTDCNPSAPSNSNNPYRLMKVVQNADGTAGAATSIAGNCSYGSLSASGTLASSASLGPPTSTGSLYIQLSSITPINGGQTIYLGIGGTASNAPIKIVNNGVDTRIYSTANLATGNVQTMAYNPIDGNIYEGSVAKGIFKFLPVTTGTAGGEVTTTVATSTGTGANCMNDGTSGAQTCVVSDAGPAFDSSGTVYFADGVQQNAPDGYRIRYIDESGNVQTIFGSLPFYGNGMQKELVRGLIGGIYYKTTNSGAGNAAAYPNGLYLISPNMVFGYINPTTGTYGTIWGNQNNNTVNLATLSGSAASSSVPMGLSYQGGSGRSMIFDSNGHPWMRSQNQIVTLNDSLQIQTMDSSTVTPWDEVTTATNPATSSVYINGGSQNLAVASNQVFLIGADHGTSGLPANPTPQIRMLDFTSANQPILLGNGHTWSQSLNTPSSATAGNVSTSALHYTCVNTAFCELQYLSSSDTLYFSDNSNFIRYITNPETPASSTLGTLGLTSSVGTIYNFSLRPDLSQVLFTTSSGGLYCYPLNAGGIKSWCPSSGAAPNLYGFSAQIGALGSMANMFTWMDNNDLMVSTGTQVLQYTLPP